MIADPLFFDEFPIRSRRSPSHFSAFCRPSRAGGDKQNFATAGNGTLPDDSFNCIWRILHNGHGSSAARGIHGQTIDIDPAAEMVLVRFASHPSAKNAAIDTTPLPACHAVAESLMNKP